MEKTTQESVTEITTKITENSAIYTTTTGKLIPFYPKQELLYSFYKKDEFYSKLIEHSNFSEKIPGTDKFYLFNNSIYFKNDSIYGEANIKTIKTDSYSLLRCDFIFFIILFSLISSSVFAGIVIIYGRGGRGYASDT